MSALVSVWRTHSVLYKLAGLLSQVSSCLGSCGVQHNHFRVCVRHCHWHIRLAMPCSVYMGSLCCLSTVLCSCAWMNFMVNCINVERAVLCKEIFRTSDSVMAQGDSDMTLSTPRYTYKACSASQTV